MKKILKIKYLVLFLFLINIFLILISVGIISHYNNHAVLNNTNKQVKNKFLSEQKNTTNEIVNTVLFVPNIVNDKEDTIYIGGKDLLGIDCSLCKSIDDGKTWQSIKYFTNTKGTVNNLYLSKVIYTYLDSGTSNTVLVSEDIYAVGVQLKTNSISTGVGSGQVVTTQIQKYDPADSYLWNTESDFDSSEVISFKIFSVSYKSGANASYTADLVFVVTKTNEQNGENIYFTLFTTKYYKLDNNQPPYRNNFISTFKLFPTKYFWFFPFSDEEQVIKDIYLTQDPYTKSIYIVFNPSSNSPANGMPVIWKGIDYTLDSFDDVPLDTDHINISSSSLTTTLGNADIKTLSFLKTKTGKERMFIAGEQKSKKSLLLEWHSSLSENIIHKNLYKNNDKKEDYSNFNVSTESYVDKIIVKHNENNKTDNTYLIITGKSLHAQDIATLFGIKIKSDFTSNVIFIKYSDNLSDIKLYHDSDFDSETYCDISSIYGESDSFFVLFNNDNKFSIDLLKISEKGNNLVISNRKYPFNSNNNSKHKRIIIWVITIVIAIAIIFVILILLILITWAVQSRLKLINGSSKGSRIRPNNKKKLKNKKRNIKAK